MKIIIKPILLLLLTVSSTGFVYGQEIEDTTTLWRIETIDGNEFIGVLINQNDQQVWIKTDILGEISIIRKNILLMEVLERDQLVKGEYWFKNPHATRYFYGPNGYGLRKGEAYYQNTWVLFNQLSYGLSSYFSIGVGVMPLFFFAGTPTPVWITPKFSIPVKKDKFNIGGGVLLGAILGESGGFFGIGFGTTTLGSRDKNLSLGIGYGFSSDGGADTPTFMLGGLIRIGRRGYLLTENYYISIGGEKLVLISLGGRSVMKKLAIDYGLIIPFASEMDSFIAIPWLGITVPFGKVAQNN